MLITSRDNAQIKALRRLLDRRHRQRAGLFLVEGWQLVREAMERRGHLATLVSAPDLCREADIAVIRRHPGAQFEVTPKVLQALVAGHGQPAVIGVAGQRCEGLDEIRPSETGCWLAVKEIRRPGSLGTLLRTCDAVGGDGAILLGDCADPYDAQSVSASHGAVFSQRLTRGSFTQVAAWARRHGCRLIGASPAGECDYRDASYQRPLVLAMGGGPAGLSAADLRLCDEVVSIPMVGRCDSHHVVVAAALVLYEAFKGRMPVTRARMHRA